MTYTNLDALIVRFGADFIQQLTDRGATMTGTIDAAAVDRALTDTDAVIDASLAVRYRLPLDPDAVPAIVADLALTIAIYKLHRLQPDAKIKEDYEQALKDLDAIALGKKKLELAGIEAPTSGAGGVVTTDRIRPLTPESMTGLI